MRTTQRIKIFTSNDAKDLEGQVNHFINENVKEIKEIQLKEGVLFFDMSKLTILLVYI